MAETYKFNADIQ